MEQQAYENNRGVRALLQHPWIYETFQRSVGKSRLRRRFVDEFVRPNPGDRILDIGCGPGDLVPFLEDVDYHGFDISEAYIASARERFGDRAAFSSGVLADVVDDLEGTCDVVVSVGVFHHVPDDVAADLAQMAARSLKGGGRYLIVEPHLFDGQGRISHALVSRDRGQFVRDEPAYCDLVASAFNSVSVTTANDLLWIPYSNTVVVGQKA